MKTTRKLLSLLLCVVLVLALCVTAFAQTENVNTGSGNITIDNTTTGKQYAIYKIFDASVSANGSTIVYTLPTGKTDFKAGGIDAGVDASNTNAKGWFTLNGSYVEVSTTPDVASADFKTWALAYGTQVGNTITADNTGSLTFANVPYGYYLVPSTLGAAVTVDSTTPDVTILDKNQSPDWDNGTDKPGKVIDVSGNKVQANTAALDEDTSFDIGVTATNYKGSDKVFHYVITDVLDAGMTYTAAPTVKVGTATLQSTAYTITYYTTTTPSGSANKTTTLSQARSFRIDIPWTSDGTKDGTHLYANEAEIHASYTAKLDSTKAANVKYNAGNENKAGFDYYMGSDTPPNPTDPVDPGHHTGTVETKTYSTDLKITKKDNNNTLTGAEFTLTGPTGTIIYTSGTRFVLDNTNGTYWKLKDGTYTTTDPNTTGVNQSLYETPLTDKYKQEAFTEVQGSGQGPTDPSTSQPTNTTIKGYVDSTGKLTFKGLTAGTYTLKESVVPAGYNKAADITFTVAFDATTEKFSVSGTTAVTTHNSGLQLEVTVENSTGTALPSTGGIGTTIFYVVGTILVLGAAVVLVTRRRMSTEK